MCKGISDLSFENACFYILQPNGLDLSGVFLTYNPGLPAEGAGGGKKSRPKTARTKSARPKTAKNKYVFISNSNFFYL